MRPSITDMFTSYDISKRLFIGKVVDNEDPDKLQRIKIRNIFLHEGIEDEDLPWAIRIVNQGIHKSIGNINIPPKNSMVVFILQDDSILYPIYIGSIQTETCLNEEIVSENYPHSYGFIDPSNNKILVDTKEKTINIEHQSGTSVFIDKEGKVDIFAQEDLNIKSFKNINMQSKEDINLLSEKNINIVSKENINTVSKLDTRMESLQNLAFVSNENLVINCFNTIATYSDTYLLNSNNNYIFSQQSTAIRAMNSVELNSSNNTFIGGSNINIEASFTYINSGSSIPSDILEIQEVEYLNLDKLQVEDIEEVEPRDDIGEELEEIIEEINEK